ncbi:hypothetical protein EPUL_002143 [Erysiphe pulchra]|uniref:Uncharacterized protein n=1 Tax=Erysiphe pulchra TaxID=225359 RepID=A0A2S4PZF3_9PEZI|nr:hypothetical protein EPUL_002143 [Erysiphe pulchra]
MANKVTVAIPRTSKFADISDEYSQQGTTTAVTTNKSEKLSYSGSQWPEEGSSNFESTAPYVAALESFLKVRFKSKADEYIDTYLVALQNLNNAADAFKSANDNENVHSVNTGLAAAIFILGTKNVD